MITVRVLVLEYNNTRICLRMSALTKLKYRVTQEKNPHHQILSSITAGKAILTTHILTLNKYIQELHIRTKRWMF